MDARFSGQALYCQISRAELALLTSGRAVDLRVQLPRNHVFRLSLRPSAMSPDRGGWQLDSDPTGIWITVPRSELEMLGQTSTFSERLMREFDVAGSQKLRVVLEALADDAKLEESVLEIVPQ